MLAADRCTPVKQTRRANRRSIVCFQYDHRRLLGNSLALKYGLFRLDLRPRRLIVSVGEGPVRAGVGIKELRLK